jgi:hypothetical protein
MPWMQEVGSRADAMARRVRRVPTVHVAGLPASECLPGWLQKRKAGEAEEVEEAEEAKVRVTGACPSWPVAAGQEGQGRSQGSR